MLKALKIFSLILSIAFLSACLEEEDINAIDDAFNPPPPVFEEPTETVDNRLCKVDQFQQPDAEIVKKIDILFVVDTSGSLDQERTAIAEGIDAFVAELPGDVDFQLGVMLAHGDRSPHSGKLYSKNSNPKVLSAQELSMDDIRHYLRDNMKRVVGEGATDGGEAGIYSFYKSLTEHKQWNQDLGFYRDDAALAVVFVSDENDICSWNNPPEGVTLLPDPNRKEIPAAKKLCDNMSSETIYELVKDHQQDRPVLMSGIIYTDENTVPRGGENEMGYGYLELLEMSNGVAIDLADGDYELGMREIGFLATKKLNLLTEFTLSNDNIDPETILVSVDNQSVDYTYQPDLNEVQISLQDAGQERSNVAIRHCQQIEAAPINIHAIQFVEATATTVLVTWRTDLRATSKVEFKNKATGEVLSSVHVRFLQTTHVIDMTGLSPATDYQVTIISTIPTNLGTETAKSIVDFTTP